MNQNNFLCFVLKRPTKEASSIILNSRSNSVCINSTFTVSISVCWSNHFTVSHGARRLRRKENLAGGETRRLSIAAPSHATPCPAAHKVDLGRRGRPNAQASVWFVPGAKARSAHQSRGLASLVRVTWCFDCSPHGSAGSTGHAEAVVGFTCPKPAGRRCWVATAGDCTYVECHWVR